MGLAKISLAETIVKGERQIYFDFVNNHTMDAESALSAELPTRLVVVDKRKRRRGSKIYCSSDFFVKHIMGSGSSNIRKEIDSQATRVRVANTVACSGAVFEIKPEEEEKRIRGEIEEKIVNDAEIFNDK